VLVASRRGQLDWRIRHQHTPFQRVDRLRRGDGGHDTDRQAQVGVFSGALGAPGPPDLPQKPEMRIGEQNA
jgi:hypothetical protein